MHSAGAFLRRHVLGVLAVFLALGGTSYAVGATTGAKAKTYYACVTAEHGDAQPDDEVGQVPVGTAEDRLQFPRRQGRCRGAGCARRGWAFGSNGTRGAEGRGRRAGSGRAERLGSPGLKGDTGPA